MDIKVINSIPQEDYNYIMSIYERLGNFHNVLEELGSGCQATVYRFKNYAIKDYSECGFDGRILEKLQDSELFPKLYFYNEDFMVYEYIEHVPAYKYYERNVDINISAIDIFKYCYEKNIVPYDIHDDNVVVTKDDKLKIIDVGSFQNKIEKPLEWYIEQEPNEFIELDNIINHVKRPPIAI